MGKTDDEGDVFYSSEESSKLNISDSKSWNLVKCAKPGTIILDLTQPETLEDWFHELFEKNLVCLDEKYLRRCFKELVHINASKSALSVNLSSSDSDENHCIGKGIVGCIMKSPVFDRLGISEHYRCDSMQQSPLSISCGLSFSPSDSRGMIEYTWRDGTPCFRLSLDRQTQKALYTAKALDCVYYFVENETDLIGKMKVSTSFLLNADNSKVMETEFVLVCANENPTPNNKQNRKMSRLSLGRKTRADLLEIDFTTNLEMAAIVVKDCTRNEEVGGWGLKFLKNKQNNTSVVSEGLTGMDVIVPVGEHGGPKNEPSSLIERWRSGGQCDCGGWDVGCPLKVLKAKPRTVEGLPGACKSFNVFSEGSKQERPTLQLVNVHEGLYSISFKSSSLSPLQCFSIAVAIIHSQSPCLRPKHVRQ